MIWEGKGGSVPRPTMASGSGNLTWVKAAWGDFLLQFECSLGNWKSLLGVSSPWEGNFQPEGWRSILAFGFGELEHPVFIGEAIFIMGKKILPTLNFSCLFHF